MENPRCRGQTPSTEDEEDRAGTHLQQEDEDSTEREDSVVTIRRLYEYEQLEHRGATISRAEFTKIQEQKEKILNCKKKGWTNFIRREQEKLYEMMEEVDTATAAMMEDVLEVMNTPHVPEKPEPRVEDVGKQKCTNKIKMPTIAFRPWNGKPDTFVKWLADIEEKIEKFNIDGTSAREMILEALPEQVRFRMSQLVSVKQVRERLWEKYGTYRTLSDGVKEIFKNISRTQDIAEFLESGVGPLEQIEEIIGNFAALGGHGREDVAQGVYTEGFRDKLEEVVPRKILKMLKEKRLLDEMADKPEEKWGWKIIEGFYNQLMEMLRTMELSQDWTQGKKVGDSHVNQGKVRAKTVNVKRLRKCVFCDEEGRQADHWALSRICNSQGISVERMEEIIKKTQSCATCLQKHTKEQECDDKTPTGAEKKCRQGCNISGQPLNFFACKHGKLFKVKTAVAVCRSGELTMSVPMVEEWNFGAGAMNVQYDSGASTTLINRETLRKIPTDMYRLGQVRTVLCSGYSGSKSSRETVQDVEINYKGVKFTGLVIPEKLEGMEFVEVEVPKCWRNKVGGARMRVGGEVSILAGSNLGRLYPDQDSQFEDFKLYRSNFTGKYMMFGHMGNLEPLNQAIVRKFTYTMELEARLLNMIREEDFSYPDQKSKLEEMRKQEAEADIIQNITVDEENKTMKISYLYDDEKLKKLGRNETGARRRAEKLAEKIGKNREVALEVDKYVREQLEQSKWEEIQPRELMNPTRQYHWTVYNFVVNQGSATTKVRFVTDSSSKTETGISLNEVVQQPPGKIPDMRGIIMRTRAADQLVIYDISKFFRTVYISDKDSDLRLLYLPIGGFENYNRKEKQEFYTVRERAIPFGDTPACDYSIACKDYIAKRNIKMVEERMREKVLESITKNCYVDDGSLLLDRVDNPKEYQEAVALVLQQGGFRIKGFESAKDGGEGKYLGLVWVKSEDCYKLKFRLNLGPVERGRRVEPDIDEESITYMETMTRRDLLGLNCQYYDPAGLGVPLVMTLRIIQSKICNSTTARITQVLGDDETGAIKRAVGEMIRGRGITFPRQIIFEKEADIVICFDGSLDAYGAAAYCVRKDGANLLTSAGKVIGKGKYTAPKAEMAGAILATRMMKKIRSELTNVNKIQFRFAGDSEIVLKIVASGQPGRLEQFFGTRLMEIREETAILQWFWIPGEQNPADLLTRAGTRAEQIQSQLWKNGGFLEDNNRDKVMVACDQLNSKKEEQVVVKKVDVEEISATDMIVRNMIKILKSKEKTERVLLLLLKKLHEVKEKRENPGTWEATVSRVSRMVLEAYQPEVDELVRNKKFSKDLIIHQVDRVYYCADRGFRIRNGVPVVDGRSDLGAAIVRDFHHNGGHLQDLEHTRARVEREFYITNVRNLIKDARRNCWRCRRTKPENLRAFDREMPDVIKDQVAPFTYVQADIFGPVMISEGMKTKRWVLVVFCLSCRGVQLESMNRYDTASVLLAFERVFATRGRPRVVWIDAGTNLCKAKVELEEGNMGRSVEALENRYRTIEFRKALPKHHETVGAVERVIGFIKRGVIPNMQGKDASLMSQEEFNTWLARIANIANNRPLVIGMPIGVTLTPNDILLGRQGEYKGSWDGKTKVAAQLARVQENLRLFHERWQGELFRRNRKVKNKTENDKIEEGDIVLIRGDGQERTVLGRVLEVYRDRTGAKFSAMLEYRRSIGGKMIRVKRHLNELSRFMSRDEVELEHGEESDEAWRPRDLAEEPTENGEGTQDVEDEFEVEHDNQEAEAM